VPVGGKRPGAGRKPGDGWQGKNPRPKAMREMAQARVREVLTTANDPLAVLIEVANDRKVDVQIRVAAASVAAPYMFPRLSAVVVASAPATAKDDTAHLVERLMTRFARLAPPVPTIEAALPSRTAPHADSPTANRPVHPAANRHFRRPAKPCV